MVPYQGRPGDIGLVYSSTKIGSFVRFAQALVGDWTVYSHAFIVLHDGYIIEALPQGAAITRLDQYNPRHLVFSNFRLTEGQRARVVEEAVRLEGTPYSFLDYLVIGLTHAGRRVNITPKWLRRYVYNSGKMMCSQLCAEAYKRAGLYLSDTSEPQDLTPGDLARIFLKYSGVRFSTHEV